MTRKELVEALDAWFKAHPKGVRKNMDPVWWVMQENLTKLGHWKNLPRGDPRKGYRIQQKRKAKDTGESWF